MSTSSAVKVQCGPDVCDTITYRSVVTMAASNKSGPFSPHSGGMTSSQHFELRNAYRE